MEVAQSQAAAHLVEGKHLLCTQTLFTLQLFALVGNLAGLLVGINHVEGIASGGGSVQT